MVSVFTGNPAPALTAGATAGSAFIGAKMLTNPKIVNWLATPVKPNSLQAAAHLARLGVIYNSIKDEALKKEVADFVQSANQPQGQQ